MTNLRKCSTAHTYQPCRFRNAIKTSTQNAKLFVTEFSIIISINFHPHQVDWWLRFVASGSKINGLFKSTGRRTWQKPKTFEAILLDKLMMKMCNFQRQRRTFKLARKAGMMRLISWNKIFQWKKKRLNRAQKNDIWITNYFNAKFDSAMTHFVRLCFWECGFVRLTNKKQLLTVDLFLLPFYVRKKFIHFGWISFYLKNGPHHSWEQHSSAVNHSLW